MNEITTRYNLDFGETFQNMEKLADSIGTVDDVLRKKRSTPVFEEQAKAATKFNQTLGQQVQISRQVEAVTNTLKRELQSLGGQYTQLVKRQEEFKAAGKYDDFLRELDKIKQRMAEIRGESDKTNGVFGKLMNWFKTPVKTNILTELAGTVGIAMGAAEAIRRVVTDWAAYGKKLSEVSALTGLVGKDLKFLSDAAVEAESRTGIAATEILEGFKQVGGIRGELLDDKVALSAVTNEVIALSQASGLSLPDAANAAVGSLNQFGEASDQAGRYVNVLAAGAKVGASEVNDTAEALKNSGTAMAAAGLSFEQGNALIQSLAGVMIKGSEAGTGLRNVILKLETDTDKNLRPSIVGLDKALENAAKKYDTTTELTKVFGSENIIAARRILDTREEISKLTKELTGTEVAYEQQRKQLDNLSTDLQKAGNDITAFFRYVGESQDGFLRRLVQGFSGTIKAIIGQGGELKAFWNGFAGSQGGLTNMLAGGFEAAGRQRQVNLESSRRQATITGIQKAAAQSVADDQKALTEAAKKRGLDEPQAIREAAQKIAKEREADYQQARADHNKLRKEYEKASEDRRREMTKDFETSRQRILFTEAARKKAVSEADRLALAEKNRQEKLKSLLSEPKSDEQKKAENKATKERQESYRLLEKAQEDYQKEIQRLEDQFGKDRLKRLNKDSDEYLRMQGELQKHELEQQRQHLIKLGQLATSTQTRKNAKTGQLEVVPNLNYQLPGSTQELFNEAGRAIDEETFRQRRILKIRQERELLELGRVSNEQELKLFDKKWEEILAVEKTGSEKYIALVKKRDRERNDLVFDQIIRDTRANEDISLSNIALRRKAGNQTGTQFQRKNELDSIATQIFSAESQVEAIRAKNDPNNSPEIKRLEAYIKALKEKRKEIEMLGTTNRDIWDLLGISKSFADETERAVFLQGVQSIADAITQTTQLLVQQSEERLQAINNEIQAKEEQVRTEEERSKEGAANNLALRQRELEDLKAKKAEEEQVRRRALRVQQALDLAAQVSNNAVTVSNTVTAISEMFKQYGKIPFVGVVLALGAIATIIGTIVSAKAKAKAITQLRDGGRINVGRTHEQGGHRIEGTNIEVEKDEWVVNRKSSQKYNALLDAINEDNPLKIVQALTEKGLGLPELVISRLGQQPAAAAQNVDLSKLELQMSTMNDRLSAIEQNTGRQIAGVGDKLVTIEGSKTTIQKLKT